MKKALFILFFLELFAKEISYNRFEGIWEDCNERRLFFLSFFLPYNPSISVSDPEKKEACQTYWPFANFETLHCDLICSESFDELLSKKTLLQQTAVIYAETKVESYPHLRTFLESFGYHLAAHWYREQEGGQAVFVKKGIFDAAMRTLNYFPENRLTSTPSYYPLSDYFKKANPKTGEHKIDEIDFIYMINLDQRPEKFTLCVNELSLYGICPYRFSAVNGWELPANSFERIGMKIFSFSEAFFGSTYQNIQGKAFLSNQPIIPNGEAYFSLGMSKGSIGIVLSHLSVLQDAYDAGFNTIWVMEDDVEVVSNPLEICELIQMLDQLEPDWDILFTDIDTKDKLNRHIPCRAIAARPNFAIESLDFYLKRFFPINDRLQSIGMRYGAYSMIVRKSGMKKILQHFMMYGIFLPYDMDFWLIPDLKLFSVTKDIVSTRASAATDNHAPLYHLSESK